MTDADAVVVGAGPNGLAAAVTLARSGLRVHVLERNPTIGGGARTMEVTLPGFRHDICSAVHPMAVASHFFREFQLARRVELRHPPVAFGHPLDGGRAGIAYPDLDRTAERLGRDGPAYRRLMAPLVARADGVAEFTGSNLVGVPSDLLAASWFALRSLEQGSPLWNLRFADDVVPAMLTGVAAHTILPMPGLAPAGAGLALGAYAHAGGWPIPVGGSQAIVDALADDLLAHGGSITTDAEITDLGDLPSARAVLLDVTPRALLRMAGDRMPRRYARSLRRFRYGNGVAKVDFALAGPVPWSNSELRSAGTVHVGGTRAEIAQAERDVAQGRHAGSPYVLASQPSIVDESRAPSGQHVLWTYTHVPRGSAIDQQEAITRQIERFAPGFRDLILAASSRTALDVERYDPNYVLGDIAAGAPSLGQLVRRPVVSTDPWRTPLPGVYLASSSTPPGPGVTGLNGWYAALSALRHEFGTRARPNLSVG
ncbi:NAD(P)/FAD-dependent oxidoreductase [Agromyces sp. Marseille-P2726]|uniref:phytoene desaturase family protein n=1 Tax=Agromyces sp. Marseille-P2726 TaxID=2709132 RepID=UPI0015707116|nr:NAD(P)/FAD-dependent oxidoreductase [Agromyces sp. Marseille-P2726]